MSYQGALLLRVGWQRWRAGLRYIMSMHFCSDALRVDFIFLDASHLDPLISGTANTALIGTARYVWIAPARTLLSHPELVHARTSVSSQ